MSTGFQDCKCVLRDGYWFLSGDPHILHRAMKIFLGASRAEGKIKIRATDETARDILWFKSRYPMKVQPEVVLRVAAGRYMMAQRKRTAILADGYEPKPVKFAEGEAPRPYQIIAADLVKASASLLLADGLGVGKTASAITAMADPAMRPALIVAPPALELQWKSQLKRFLPDLSVHAVDSTKPYALNVMKPCQCGAMVDSRLHTKWSKLFCPKCNLPVHAGGRSPDVVLCSYTKLDNWADHLSRFAKMVVWEECHSLRRSDSLKWKAAKTIADSVPVKMGLSGTPIYNYGGEMWNVLECIAPGFLGPKDTFRETWCSGYGGQGKEPALSDPEALGSYLRSHGVMLRRTAEEVGIKLDAHQKITYPIQADTSAFNAVSGRAAELARIILDEAKQKRGDSMRASGEFDAMMRQATALAKLPYVADFVELLLEQDIPVVLFAYHRQVYDVLSTRMNRWRPAFYTGTESSLQKDAAVTRFRNGDTSLFVCSLRSGEGLDGLQFRSCTNVFAELDWSPACMDQCCGRTYRDGQKHPVNSYFLVSDFGIDPIMSQVLGLKRDQSEGLLGSRSIGPVKKIDQAQAIRDLAMKYLSRR